MIRVALQTLRARWVSLLGTFVALVLGTGLVASMGLLLLGTSSLPQRPVQRFATAPAVVQPNDPSWNAAEHDLGALSLAQAEGISPALLTRVSATGPVVVDRSFYAQISGGPEDGVDIRGRWLGSAATGWWRVWPRLQTTRWWCPPTRAGWGSG